MKQLTLDREYSSNNLMEVPQGSQGDKEETLTSNEYLTSICSEVYDKIYERVIDHISKSKTHKQKYTNIKKLKINAEFYPYSNIKLTIHTRADGLHIRMSDILSDAPKEILSCAAVCIISQQLYVKCDPAFRKRYRDYIYSQDIRNRVREVRRVRARKKVPGPKGRYFDLNSIFKEINSKYFENTLPKFTLCWSERQSRWRYGYYDSDLNTIVVTRRLDKKNTPKYVVKYVLYHEILHWCYPSRYVNGRRRVHTPEFKAAEQKFERYSQAKSWLKKKK